jgi:hypothetical protein
MNLYALGVEDPETDPECDSPELHTAMSGALTFNKHSDRFALMSIYEQRLNRSIHKNLTTLRELKAEREKLYKKDLENEVLLAQANDSNGLPYQAPTRKSQNGFVFSTAEVLATANRRSVLYNALATKKPTKERIQFAGAWEAFEEPSPNKPNSGLKMAVAA